MQNGSLVSIVIPCHNTERWIAKCVESALEQTWGNIEIIVVNDGSTDNSAGIASQYGRQIKLIRGSWRNGNSARNAGLDIASGDWVQFLDADDFLKADKIAGQLSGSRDGVEMIYSPLIMREEAASGDATETLVKPTTGFDLIKQWLRWEFCQTGAALWRTESLRRIGGWKEGLPCCQDNELTLRALKKGLNIEFVDQPGAVYRIWSEETVCRRDPRRVIEMKTQLIDECLSWLRREDRLEERYLRAAGQACFEMARTLATHDLDQAVRYYRERRELGLILPVGPAAPLKFRLALRAGGFHFAEKLGAWRR